jgi:YHS domain-containing protein
MKEKILMLVVTMLSVATFAQSTKHLNVKDKIAIQGFDPVAYFESNKAIEGKKEIVADYNGATYQFSSENNKVLFLKNPAQYEPQFGGFCAYGISEGHESPIQPEAFTIVDHKLYLNYNLKVRALWSKDQATRIEKANVNWKKGISE